MTATTSERSTPQQRKFRGITAPPELFEAVATNVLSPAQAWLALTIGTYVEMKGEGCWADEETLAADNGKKIRQLHDDLKTLRGFRKNPDTGEWEQTLSSPRFVRIVGWKTFPNGKCIKVLETKWARIDEDVTWNQVKDAPCPHKQSPGRPKKSAGGGMRKTAKGGYAENRKAPYAENRIQDNRINIDGIAKEPPNGGRPPEILPSPDVQPAPTKPSSGSGGGVPVPANRVKGMFCDSPMPVYADNGFPGYCYEFADRLHVLAEKTLDKQIKFSRKAWAASFQEIVSRCKDNHSRVRRILELAEKYCGEAGWPKKVQHPKHFEGLFGWFEEESEKITGEPTKIRKLVYDRIGTSKNGNPITRPRFVDE